MVGLQITRLSGRGQLLGQVLVNGIQSKFQPVRDSQLVEDMIETIFDRQFRDEEFLSDLFVPIALRHQSHDRLFAIVQQRLYLQGPFI
jgi:hypothetical protein